METTDDKVEPEADSYVDLMPHICEVENEETVKSRYKKVGILAVFQSDILQTLSVGAVVIRANFDVKALKYRNLKSLKEVAPLRISQQKTAAKELPSELLFEITDEEKMYAYVPEQVR